MCHLVSLLYGLCETDNGKESMGKQPHGKEIRKGGKEERGKGEREEGREGKGKRERGWK